MNNRFLVVLLLSIPVATLISYVLFKVYSKHVAPSIIGVVILALYAVVDAFIEGKNEKS
jgi:hypothetical protein